MKHLFISLLYFINLINGDSNSSIDIFHQHLNIFKNVIPHKHKESRPLIESTQDGVPINYNKVPTVVLKTIEQEIEVEEPGINLKSVAEVVDQKFNKKPRPKNMEESDGKGNRKFNKKLQFKKEKEVEETDNGEFSFDALDEIKRLEALILDLRKEMAYQQERFEKELKAIHNTKHLFHKYDAEDGIKVEEVEQDGEEELSDNKYDIDDGAKTQAVEQEVGEEQSSDEEVTNAPFQVEDENLRVDNDQVKEEEILVEENTSIEPTSNVLNSEDIQLYKSPPETTNAHLAIGKNKAKDILNLKNPPNSVLMIYPPSHNKLKVSDLQYSKPKTFMFDYTLTSTESTSYQVTTIPPTKIEKSKSPIKTLAYATSTKFKPSTRTKGSKTPTNTTSKSKRKSKQRSTMTNTFLMTKLFDNAVKTSTTQRDHHNLFHNTNKSINFDVFKELQALFHRNSATGTYQHSLQTIIISFIVIIIYTF
ncbi:unnamed protein product [Candida verbasci]|uniref:Uncharacterized protein n=1 Tax=Candida verbasci TaxID=1227364 RepID=A0A9W4TTK8_9ASCO|nr:unnamed protein product [Candida verbasci]